jgi:mono/diheme cytochrome c family protein
VIPACLIAVVVWRVFRSKLAEVFGPRHAISGGVVFLLLALWSLKYRAPLGPSVVDLTADYLPRPGAQFLWLYQSLKYLPGGLGSLAGVALPGVVLLILVLLPWLKQQRMIGGTILGVGLVLVVVMTTASYVSDHRDPKTSRQLAIQAAHEDVWRREPFKPATITLAVTTPAPANTSGGPPVLYTKFCANCHGPNGEGARQGRLSFPPLLDVAAKPRRSVNDIVEILKDPPAYGLSPPMRSFSDKLNDEQMKEIGEWIVKLKR